MIWFMSQRNYLSFHSKEIPQALLLDCLTGHASSLITELQDVSFDYTMVHCVLTVSLDVTGKVSCDFSEPLRCVLLHKQSNVALSHIASQLDLLRGRRQGSFNTHTQTVHDTWNKTVFTLCGEEGER